MHSLLMSRVGGPEIDIGRREREFQSCEAVWRQRSLILDFIWMRRVALAMQCWNTMQVDQRTFHVAVFPFCLLHVLFDICPPLLQT